MRSLRLFQHVSAASRQASLRIDTAERFEPFAREWNDRVEGHEKAGSMRFLEQLGLMGDKIDRHVHKIAGYHHRDILIASRFKRGDEPEEELRACRTCRGARRRPG